MKPTDSDSARSGNSGPQELYGYGAMLDMPRPKIDQVDLYCESCGRFMGCLDLTEPEQSIDSQLLAHPFCNECARAK